MKIRSHDRSSGRRPRWTFSAAALLACCSLMAVAFAAVRLVQLPWDIPPDRWRQVDIARDVALQLLAGAAGGAAVGALLGQIRHALLGALVGLLAAAAAAPLILAWLTMRSLGWFSL